MSYPPDDHMLRALALETRVGDDEARVRAPVHPHLFHAAGAVRLGILAVVVDVAAASLSLRALHPDRTATIGLSLQSARACRSGPLEARARIVRQGTKQVVSEVCLHDDTDEALPLARSLVAFQRLPYRGDHHDIPDMRSGITRSSMAHPAAELREPFVSRAGVRIVDPAGGVVEIDNHEWVRNSFRTLNGGMVATLAELAGEQAARVALGDEGVVAADLDLHYVGQGGDGPIRTRAEPLRASGSEAVCRVSVHDAGKGDALMAIGTVHAAALA